MKTCTKLMLRAALGLALATPMALAPSSDAQLLTQIGRYATGIFDESAAEIVSYDAATQRLFVVNAEVGIDVVDLSDPTSPSLLFNIGVPNGFGGINSVAVNNGLVAVAVEADAALDNGSVFFYDADGNALNSVEVGVLPDSLAFTPDGSKVIVANEAEPDVELDEDEENIVTFNGDAKGTISIVDLSGGVGSASATTLNFDSFAGSEAALRAGGAIFSLKDGDGVPGEIGFSEDLEPEFVAVAPDGKTAFVSVQENNIIAVVDLETDSITDLVPLGLKDNSLPGNGFDPSNKDGGINIGLQPTKSAFAPDTITVFEQDGETYVVTANEGDARDFDIRRIKDADLDPTEFPVAINADGLGRLEVSKTAGDTDMDGDLDELIAFGARSFSIWKVTDTGLEQVFDSGDDFEQITAALIPEGFNSTNDENAFDNRSDDAGPEPEAVTVAKVFNNVYAFVGLERIGGVMVYDITDPLSPTFLEYINNRNFDPEFNVETGIDTFDLGPESLLFISSEESGNGKDLLVVANEVSGSTTIYEFTAVPSPSVFAGGLFGIAALASRRRRA